MNRNSLKIYVQDDSLELQNQAVQHRRYAQTSKHQNTSSSNNYFQALTYSSKKQVHFNPNKQYLNKCSQILTPQTKATAKVTNFNFKSPKYTGIIEKTLMDRIKYYQDNHKKLKQQKQLQNRLQRQEKSLSQTKPKPSINKISQQLFKKVKKERRLSPNVLDRFQTYEYQRLDRETRNMMECMNKSGTLYPKKSRNTIVSALKERDCNCSSKSPQNRSNKSMLKSYRTNINSNHNNNIQNQSSTARYKKTQRDIGKLIKTPQLQQKKKYNKCLKNQFNNTFSTIQTEKQRNQNQQIYGIENDYVPILHQPQSKRILKEMIEIKTSKERKRKSKTPTKRWKVIA